MYGYVFVMLCLCSLTYCTGNSSLASCVKLSEDCNLKHFFHILPQNIGYDISCKLSSMETTGMQCITKTCLYNFDPLKPHFYITKLGLTGVYIVFLFFLLLKNIKCEYSLEPPRRGGSNEYPQSMFRAEI